MQIFPAFSREKIRYIGDCALRLQLHQGVDILLRGITQEIFVGPYNYNKIFVAAQHSHFLQQKKSVVEWKNAFVIDLLLPDGQSDSDETCWVNHVWVAECSWPHFDFPAFSGEKIRYIRTCASRLQVHERVYVELWSSKEKYLWGPIIIINFSLQSNIPTFCVRKRQL